MSARTNKAPAAALARGLMRLHTAGIAYLAIFAMALALVALGMLPLRQASIVTGYCLIGHIGFYFFLRSGLSLGFADPACAFAHVLFGISTLLLGCALIPQDRVAALQLFFLIVAFDLTRLSQRQVSIAAASVIVGLVLVSLNAWRMTGNTVLLQRELLALAMAGVYVPLLVHVGRVVRELMRRHSSQRAAIAAALEQLQALSERDALTGASNRRHADAVLAREAARRSSSDTPLSLGLLDIDHFKRINDSHGHAAGDAVLVALVRLMHDALPATFTVARWGGEEFLVVMPETELASAAALMRRLRGEISVADWSHCAPALRVDVSIGVCEHAADGEFEASIDRADAALYQAKSEGRGRVVEQLHH